MKRSGIPIHEVRSGSPGRSTKILLIQEDFLFLEIFRARSEAQRNPVERSETGSPSRSTKSLPNTEGFFVFGILFQLAL